MKYVSLIILLLLGFASQFYAQTTPGIVGGSGFTIDDLSNEFFRNKDRQRGRERNQRLQEQNERLERQVYDLEEQLDDCMRDARRSRTRYPRSRRSYDNRYSMTNNFIGERKLEREYDRLREENEFLRDQREWLLQELEDCENRYRRDRTRTRNGDRAYSNCRSHCNCCHHGHHKQKHKHHKHHRCHRDDD